MREICIHGHYYQPTRVDPWTDIVDHQPSAAPFTDWNHRIAADSPDKIWGPSTRFLRKEKSLRFLFSSFLFFIMYNDLK